MALQSFQLHSRTQVRATAAAELGLHAEVCQATSSALTKLEPPETLDVLFAAMSRLNCKSCSQRPTCSSHHAATHQGGPVRQWHQDCSRHRLPARRLAAGGLKRGPAAAGPAVCELLCPAGSQQNCSVLLLNICDKLLLLPGHHMNEGWHLRAICLVASLQGHTPALHACYVSTQHVSCL